MEIVGKEHVEAFQAKHPWSRIPLAKWIKAIETNTWHHFAELRSSFRTVDYVNGFTVFDIKGNDLRLIAVVRYVRNQLIVRHIFTHNEYNQWCKSMMRNKRKKR